MEPERGIPMGGEVDTLTASNTPKSENRRRRGGEIQRAEQAKAKVARIEQQALVPGNVVKIQPADPRPVPVRRVVQRLIVTQHHRAALAGYGPYVGLRLPTKKKSYRLHISFLVCVILPIAIASIYYVFYASRQYGTEFRFSVQDTSPTTASAPSSVTSLLSAVGAGSHSANDNYIVTDFLGSREAVDELQKRINVIQLYSKSDTDWWSRFDASKPIEDFIPYWQQMVTAQYDQVTSIATVRVRAFTAQDALLIGNTLVTMSEELVNRISNRSALESVRFAETELAKAESRLKKAKLAMADFRNRTGVIDPLASLVASNSQLTQSLRGNLNQLETQLATLQRQNVSPTSPIFTTLENQIRSTKDRIRAVESTVAQDQGGQPLSNVMSEYEEVKLEDQFGQSMVTSAMQQLELARANAAAQHLFITPYVRPRLPESPSFPKPVRAIGFVAFLAFVFWLCSLLIMRSINERLA